MTGYWNYSSGTADATASSTWSSAGTAANFYDVAPAQFIDYSDRMKDQIKKSKAEKPKMLVSELITLWESDNFKMIKVGSERDRDGWMWILFECHLPYYNANYGRHACLRIKSKNGRVYEYQAFNISRRNGDDPSGIPIKPPGVL